MIGAIDGIGPRKTKAFFPPLFQFLVSMTGPGKNRRDILHEGLDEKG